MSDQTTRRSFLGTTIAAGGCVLARGLTRTANSQERQAASSVPVSAPKSSAPLVVVTQPTSKEQCARAATWSYITEILQRAGLFFDQRAPDDLPSEVPQSKPIVLLAGSLQLSRERRQWLSELVRQGGSLIGIGGTSGLDELFGVKGGRPLAEGWIKVTAENHPVTTGLRSSLHVFGGYAVQPASATTLANVESGSQGAKGSAILENRVGKGRAILLSPDLLFSIVHIQQGVPVFQDGKPAPDGTAMVDDGELKAEDGLVLDWQRDRVRMPGDGEPVFLEPITDELREIILRAVFHSAREQGIALPVLWYWPRGLRAVGHISHDTDGNDPLKAKALLEVVKDCQVKTTWCTLYPGGYPRTFYDALKDLDYEIALHYDARTGQPETSWSRKNLVLQYNWLLKEAGLKHISSNKNHYTRWEGRLDFLRWCEQIGIRSDQTRGPSKKGSIGFPLGGSQPYYPLDDEAATPRIIKVLEVNMLTQDIVVVCPGEYGRKLLASVLPHHGVAHFLFHPAHIQKPGVADAFRELIQYGRDQGIEWWTSRQIHQWETTRRSVESQCDGPGKFTLTAKSQLPHATLLFLKPKTGGRAVRVDGRPTTTRSFKLHGFEFDSVTMDLSGRMHVNVG